MLGAVAPATVAASPLASTPIRTWQPNGMVHEVIASRDGSRAFLGGAFTSVGPYSGTSVRVNGLSGAREGAWPTFEGGDVYDIVADPRPAGGWFVAGAFTGVGLEDRSYLVRIDAAGRLDPFWNAGVGFDGIVRTLELDGVRLLVGGSFTSFNGTQVGRLTAFDLASNTPDTPIAWTGNYDANGTVEDIEITGGHAWVAGNFTAFHDGVVDNAAGRYIIRLDLQTGAPDLWVPQPPAAGSYYGIRDIAIDAGGERVYAGGSFTAVGDSTTPVPRNRLVAYSQVDGVLDSNWTPDASWDVNALAIHDGFVYAGGRFDAINGSLAHKKIARLDPVTGAVDPNWAIQLNDGVTEIDVSSSGSWLYVGGYFSRVGAQPLHGAAMLSTAAGAPASVSTWAPMVGRAVEAFTETPGGSVLMGGRFITSGVVERRGLAAIDLGSGELLQGWNPAASIAQTKVEVRALELYDGSLFAGGALDSSPVVLRVVADSGLLEKSFSVGTGTGKVYDAEMDQGTGQLIIGGTFTGPGATYLAALRIDDGLLQDFGSAVGMNAGVNAVDVESDRVYVGGGFVSPRLHAAAFNIGPGPGYGSFDGSWAPDTQWKVDALAVDGANGRVYIAAPAAPSYVVAVQQGNGSPSGHSFSLPPPHPVGTMHVGPSGGLLVGGGSPDPWQLAHHDVYGAHQADAPPSWYAGWRVTDITSVGARLLVGTARGFLIFEPRNDITDPTIGSLAIDADPARGTLARGNVVVARTNGPVKPEFTVRVRAHDALPALGAATYAEVSGLEEVQWGAVPDAAGIWTPGSSSDQGHARGLEIRCWRTDIVGPTAFGSDTSVNYPLARRPEMHASTPARVLREAGAQLVTDAFANQHYDSVACRWRGELVGRGTATQGMHDFQTVSDDGMQLSVGGPDDETWPTIDNWLGGPYTPVDSDPVDFGIGGTKRFDTRWRDATNEAFAQVLWDTPPLEGDFEPIPEGAFVRGVDYQRTYRFEGGPSTQGAIAPFTVDAVDRAGGRTTVGVEVAIDDKPPIPSPISTAPGAGAWSSSQTMTITFSDADDEGLAGFGDRQLQIRDAPFDANGGCALAGVVAPEAGWTDVPPLHTGAPETNVTVTRVVTNGCWQVRLVSHDLLGNERKSYPTNQGPTGVEQWVQIDQTPPTGGSIVVAAQTSAASSVDVLVDALPTDQNSGMASMNLERQVGAFSGGACGPWETTWGDPAPVTTARTYTMSGLADGSCYRFRLAATDGAGNWFGVESASEVGVDQTAPAATLDPISATGVVGSSATVTGSMTDAASGITAASVTYSGPESGSVCLPRAQAWSCPWDTSGLQEGDYTVTFTVSDVAGNATSVTQGVRVDRSAPAVTLSASEVVGAQYQHFAPGAPAKLWINPAQSGSLDLVAIVSDASASHVDFPTFGPNWTPTTAETIYAPAAFRRTYSWTPGAVGAGRQTLVAWDMAGASSTATVEVVSDSAAPTTDPPSYTGGYGTVKRMVSWDPVNTADQTGGSGLAALELQVAEAPLADGACGAWGGWSSLGTRTPPYEAILAEGRCTKFQLVAHDNVGNQRPVQSSVVAMLDTTRPTSAFDAAPTGPVSGDVTLTGTVTDAASGGAWVDVFFTGPTGYMACDDLAVSGGTWTCPWDTKATTGSTDGTYTLYVVATDQAGNVQDPAATRSIVVDNQAPTLAPVVAAQAGSEGSVYHDAAAKTVWFDPRASGGFRLDTRATDAGTGVASAAFPLLGTAWTPTTPDPYVVYAAPWAIDYQWLANAPERADALTYTVSDAAGAMATDTFTVRADTAPPTGGSVNYANAPSGAPQIAFVVGSDAGSGVKTWKIERRETTATPAGTCDETGWQAWSAITVGPASPWADDSVQRSRCYEYGLVVVDHLGETARYADPEGDRFITRTPGIVLGPAGVVPAATEGGATASYEVSLRAAPTADVTISLAGDADVAASPESLTFTPANWTAPQRVTVTAIDDAIDETSPETASISHDASSADSAYDTMPVASQDVTVHDDDQAAVVLTQTGSGTSVTEGGAGDGYSVRLGSQPTANVSVTLAVPAQLETTPTVLTFTPDSWSSPQTVAVAAAPDPDIEGPHGATIRHAASSTDAAYRFQAGDVSVTIADDDVAGLEVVPSSATPTVTEQPGEATETVRVRLTARPSSVVNVGALGAAGQVAATPSSLQFTASSWDTWQTVTLSGVDDTRAEASPHAAMATFSASSTDPNFASVPERVISLGVTDNDRAGFTSTPGARWHLDAQGRLKLAETGEATATVTITAMGDPSADVVLAPKVTPAGEVVVAPAQATIPAGSHRHSVTFRVHAVDDRVAEPTPHPARLEFEVRTQDPMYASVVPAATSIAITDGAEPVLREEEPAPTEPVKEPVKQTTPDPAPPAKDPAPPANDPAPPAEDPRPVAEDPAPKEDGTKSDEAQPPKESRERDGNTSTREEDEPGNVVSRAAGRVKQWAKENKAAAAAGAGAAGTAALWGAKPLMLAGKALGSGGLNIPGMPGPDGMGQARRLLRMGRKARKEPFGLRLMRFLLRRGRDAAEHVDLERTLDQDWDDFYNDRAA